MSLPKSATSGSGAGWKVGQLSDIAPFRSADIYSIERGAQLDAGRSEAQDPWRAERSVFESILIGATS